MKNKHFFIGCSGYYYSTWKKMFYPEGLPSSKWLEYYSTIFNSVELNGTFHRVPSLFTLQKYYNQVPEHFGFTVKASKYITHILRLKDSSEKIKEFADLMYNGLQEKLQNILFQLPPSFHYSEENIEALISNIPPVKSHVIEFRHISWWENKIDELLSGYGYTFCNTDYPGLKQSFTKTSENFYARLHGVPVLFKSSYSDEYLRDFSKRIPECKSCCVYFNNTWFDAAYKNAATLKTYLED